MRKPRSGLFQKAVSGYPNSGHSPADRLDGGRTKARAPNVPRQVRCHRAVCLRRRRTLCRAPRAASAFVVTPATAVVDLSFNTETLPWAGDLGAFLRDRITPTMKNVRVTVTGSGPHQFTPVRLAGTDVAGASRRAGRNCRAAIVGPAAGIIGYGLDRAQTGCTDPDQFRPPSRRNLASRPSHPR